LIGLGPCREDSRKRGDDRLSGHDGQLG
jgi:hypothetical protein